MGLKGRCKKAERMREEAGTQRARTECNDKVRSRNIQKDIENDERIYEG